MKTEKLQGMILAAGMGKRLGNFEGMISKPLLQVAGETLIEHMIGFNRRVGVKELIVVGGFKYEALEAVVAKADPNVILARNPRFELQNLLSFQAGLEKAKDEDLFVCNADYIFMPHTVEAIKNSPDALSIYASYDISGDAVDVMKVGVDGEKNLVEMSKKLVTFDAIYTGMFFIPKKDMPVVREIVAELIKTTDLEKASVELLFSALLSKGYSVKVSDVGAPDWFEIDTVEEWEVAKKALER